jgi:hypothetical protein
LSSSLSGSINTNRTGTTKRLLVDWKPNEANAIDYRRGRGHSLAAHCDDRQLSGRILVRDMREIKEMREICVHSVCVHSVCVCVCVCVCKRTVCIQCVCVCVHVRCVYNVCVCGVNEACVGVSFHV